MRELKGNTLFFIKKLFLSFILLSVFIYLEIKVTVGYEQIVAVSGVILIWGINLIWLYMLVYKNRFKFLMKQRNKKLNKNFKFNIDNLIYYNDVCEEFPEFINLLLSTVKRMQLEDFIQQDYKIVIGYQQELNILCKRKNISGLFDKMHRVILLYIPENTDISFCNSLRGTFYHEWGHFLDFINDMISETEKYKGEYKRQKRFFEQKVRLLYSNNLRMYFFQNPIHNLYELKNSCEFFAVNYSNYKLGLRCNKLYFEFFNILEG